MMYFLKHPTLADMPRMPGVSKDPGLGESEKTGTSPGLSASALLTLGLDASVVGVGGRGGGVDLCIVGYLANISGFYPLNVKSILPPVVTTKGHTSPGEAKSSSDRNHRRT